MPQIIFANTMVLERQGAPLVARQCRVAAPGRGEVLIKVHACGVCRTDLHVVDGDLTHPKLPLVLGHEIVGTISSLGEGCDRFSPGDRVGVPWLGWTCGHCRNCGAGRENLCESARFTGYTIDGGYAEYTIADARYCFPIPAGIGDAEAAPLLCAGLIGYRSLCMTEDGERLGIYGFGAAAHIVAQVARHQGRQVFAFVRRGDEPGRQFALEMGAAWAGWSDEAPPDELDAAIIFAPAGELVPAALRAVGPGGVVVCGGIHMTDIPSFPYEILWKERKLVSVANLTRRDGEEFFAMAPKVALTTQIEEMPLRSANEALSKLREGRLKGAAVLTMEGHRKAAADARMTAS